MDISIGGSFTPQMDNYARRGGLGPAFQDVNDDNYRDRYEAAQPALDRSDKAGRTGRLGDGDSKKNDPQAAGETREDSLELSPEARKIVEELKARDRQVRAHEAAHVAAGAGVVKGGASFSMQRGPDGQMYAVGGEVPIDSSEENDPRSTMAKAQQIATAALAPSDPSPQDRAVAAAARQMEAKAAAELARQPSESEAPEIPPVPEATDGKAGNDSGEQTVNNVNENSSRRVRVDSDDDTSTRANGKELPMQGRQAIETYNTYSNAQTQGAAASARVIFQAVA